MRFAISTPRKLCPAQQTGHLVLDIAVSDGAPWRPGIVATHRLLINWLIELFINGAQLWALICNQVFKIHT